MTDSGRCYACILAAESMISCCMTVLSGSRSVDMLAVVCEVHLPAMQLSMT